MVLRVPQAQRAIERLAGRSALDANAFTEAALRSIYELDRHDGAGDVSRDDGSGGKFARRNQS
jgi:hypothetical protein